MTNQARIEELHQRVTAWSERFDASGGTIESIQNDPDFHQLLEELMMEDMDTIMVLLGKSAAETGEIGILNLLNELE